MRVEEIRADTKSIRGMGYGFLENRKYRTDHEAVQDFKRIEDDPGAPI